MFAKKATKIDEIFTVDLTVCSKCQIDCEYFFRCNFEIPAIVKFVFSKKVTKFDKTVDLTLTTYCQIDGEDFFNFFGLLRKHEL